MEEGADKSVVTRRGLIGPKGWGFLIAMVVVGIGLVVATRVIRHRTLEPKLIPRVPESPARVLALRDMARGISPQVAFVAGDLARVSSYAAARRATDEWQGLEPDAILKVSETSVVNGETWVRGAIQAGQRNEVVTVHASFLERYMPVVLDNIVEISEIRLERSRKKAEPGLTVSGRLRNITTQDISQCVVAGLFEDQNDREVDTRWSPPLKLTPWQFVEFQTPPTGKPFHSFTIQITYASPEGLRNYLSAVVVNKSSQ